MATALVIEEERGTCTGHVHPHNGYFAGDFGRQPAMSSTPADVRRIAAPVRLQVVSRPSAQRTVARLAA
jgi:hypothetical protein